MLVTQFLSTTAVIPFMPLDLGHQSDHGFDVRDKNVIKVRVHGLSNFQPIAYSVCAGLSQLFHVWKQIEDV